MKRLMLLLAFLISIGTSAFGQLVKEVTLTSETNLATALGEDVAKVTTLKITGSLTMEDFTTMKDNMAMLQVLDMSGVTSLPETDHYEYSGNVKYQYIPESALQDRPALQTVYFPACMNEIGQNAFSGCNSLNIIIFPINSQLKQISERAFSQCVKLEVLDLTSCKSLKIIKERSFEECSKLSMVNLANCSALQQINIGAFWKCSTLQSVDLSNCSQLQGIGEYVFWDCSMLSTVSCVGCTNLSTIDNYAFTKTKSLLTFDFVALTALTRIGFSAFSMGGLSGEITFGKSLQSIENNAFGGCSITAIKFEEHSALITLDGAFSSCSQLVTIDFTNCASLASLNPGVFSASHSLQEIKINNAYFQSKDGVLMDKNQQTLLFYPYGKLGQSYEIPSSVQTIASGSFPIAQQRFVNVSSSIELLEKLIIPSTVLKIEPSAFTTDVDYPKRRLFVNLLSSDPIGLSSTVGLEDALIYVPKGALSAYKEAAIWKDYTLIETGAEGTIVELVTAGSLGAKLTELGVTLNTIQELTITGPMNASDFETIKQMTLLTKVDLSGTTMEENRLPNYAFSGLSYLKEVKLPNSITVIGSEAFNSLSNLEMVNLPTLLESIENHTFYNCTSMQEIDLFSLEHLRSIGGSAFLNCSAIPSTLKLPNSLESISWDAFYGTKVTSVDFSNTSLRSIGGEAFLDCAITGELSFPATLTSIGNGAFNAATPNSIKLKSAEMVRLDGTDVFKAAKGTTCSVYVPKGLGATYKADTYWSPFGNNIEEYGYLVTVTVNDGYGYVTGGRAYEEGETVTLTASMYEYRHGLFAGWFENNQKLSGELTYSFTMEKADRSIEARFLTEGYGIEGWNATVNDQDKADGQTVTLWPYNSSLWVKGELDWNLKKFTYSRGASLLVESPVTAEQINVQASMSGNQWYFISFPYDLKLSDIVLEQDHQFVVREYDGTARATNGMGASWKQLPADATMKANKGYIIQFAQSSGFDSYNAASVMEALFNRQAVTIPLEKHASNVPADENWNLVGNPFPCYFSVKQLFDAGLDGTVTVWSDQLQNYEYYTQDDQGAYLAPLTAFFIQHGGSTSSVIFTPEGRAATLPTTRAAMADLRSDTGREVINLQLANDSLSDKTRVVFNEAASTDYELGKDAAKFSSMNSNAPSLYTLDAQNQQLAINERPVGNGVVRLGCYIGMKGSYTLSAKEALASDLYLYDTETGASCNLRETNYTFTAEAGVCNNRFELRTSLKGTGVETIEGFSWQVAGNQLQLNGLPVGATVSLFDANGRMRFTGDAATAAAGIALPQSGIYYLTIRTAEGVSSTISIKR